MAKYTLEQLQQRAKGTKTLEELRGETQQTQEEQPKNFFENVGSFVGGVLTDITKPVVQSLASPYQAVATAYNIAKAPSKEKVESETTKTSAVIKRMRELESKGQSKTAEYSNLVSQLKQKSEAYKKTDTFVAPTTIKTGIWGDIEAPKTAEEVLGTGAKTLSLAASPAVGGALWGAGEAMQQNKGLPEVIGYGVTGGVLGKAGELAFKALGSVMKVGGKALASSKFGQAAAGTLTATEKNAERVMASLIKPLKKNLTYGKKPALELAREVAKADKTPGNWEELATFVTKVKQKVGKELGNYYNKADKIIKTRFNAKTALETIDGAMDEAAARNNTSLMNRLSELKQALTQNLVKKFDKKTGKWIIKSAGEKDLTKLKPSEVQNLIREISEQVKWTGNYSDDLTVNRALQDTYRTLRKGLEAGITKENKALGTTIRRLNEKYGNLVSADDAVRYRKGVVNRQALISLTDQEAATAGGLIQSIASGGVNVGTILAGIGSGTLSKFIKSPWFATNLTKAIMKLSPVKRQGILLKYPILRKAIKGMTTATGKALEKTGAFLEGTPSKIKQIQKSPVTGKVIPMGLSIDDVSKQSFKKAGVPKTQTIDAGLAKTIRESKGLSADDIMKKYPDIQLKRDVPAKDIHGNKIEIPKGEVLTPYEVKGNKVLLQDGETYVVAKNQFQNIKGNSTVAEGKKFAPELEGLEETVKGGKVDVDIKVEKNNSGTWIIYTDGKKTGGIGKTLNGKELTREEALQIAKQSVGDNYVSRGKSPTKYSQYTLPGGENYREVLIKAPTIKSNKLIKLPEGTKVWRVGQSGAMETPNGQRMTFDLVEGKDINDLALDALNKNIKPMLVDSGFKSSHWDEPNVISHVRLNDRTYNGKKVTFMEELQSDWAREARKGEKQILNPLDNPDFHKPVLGELPTHSALKNWQQLSIKRALKDAVDNNSDYFAWTTGEQQSARYNLATHVDNVKWNDYGQIGSGQKSIYIKPKNKSSEIRIVIDKGGNIKETAKSDWQGKKLDEVLGKGLADKIMEKETGTLSGEGLKFGGEWANNLYDKQVKNIVEDLTGQKVEMIDLGLPIEAKDISVFREVERITDSGHIVSGLKIEPKDLKIGKKIISGATNEVADDSVYIITDILGDGKFKAVEKNRINAINVLHKGKQNAKDLIKRDIDKLTETFDISQKTTQQQGIKLTPKVKVIIKGEAPKLKKSMPSLPSKTLTGYHIVRNPKAVAAIEKEGFSLKKFGSESGTKEIGDPKGVYFFTDKNAIKNLEGWSDIATSKNTLKRTLNLEKPYIVKSAQQYFDDIVKPATNTKAKTLEQFRGIANINDSEKVTNYALKQGYDGILDKEGLLSFDEPQIIVLDLKKIKK